MQIFQHIFSIFFSTADTALPDPGSLFLFANIKKFLTYTKKSRTFVRDSEKNNREWYSIESLFPIYHVSNEVYKVFCHEL